MGEEEEEVRPEEEEAGLREEGAPWKGCPWAGAAVPPRPRAAGAVAMAAGCLCPGWRWWWYFAARASGCWWPCCWWEVGAEPAVAMAAEAQKEEVAAGFRGEEVAGASCPLVEEGDPWGVREVLDHGPWGEEEAASMEEASHSGLEASEVLPCWPWEEESCVGRLALLVLRACHGSSGFLLVQSSSTEVGSEEAGCYWALQVEGLHQGGWHVLLQMGEQEPLPAPPSETDILYPCELCPGQTAAVPLLQLCEQQKYWNICSQRRCVLLHHTLYITWCL